MRDVVSNEEIVQEAFLAFWRNPGGYEEDRGSVRAWLMSTVHHRAVDAVRREEAQRRRTQESQAEETVQHLHLLWRITRVVIS